MTRRSRSQSIQFVLFETESPSLNETTIKYSLAIDVVVRALPSLPSREPLLEHRNDSNHGTSSHLPPCPSQNRCRRTNL